MLFRRPTINEIHTDFFKQVKRLWHFTITDGKIKSYD